MVNLFSDNRTPFNNKLRAKLVTAAATAYAPGLYALEHVSPDEMQQIENKVVGKIETEASPILNKLIERRPSELSAQGRYWWAVYLNASVDRDPHAPLLGANVALICFPKKARFAEPLVCAYCLTCLTSGDVPLR